MQLTKTIFQNFAIFIEKKWVENRLWLKSGFCGEKELIHSWAAWPGCQGAGWPGPPDPGGSARISDFPDTGRGPGGSRPLSVTNSVRLPDAGEAARAVT